MVTTSVIRTFGRAVLLAVLFGVYGAMASAQPIPISTCGPIPASGSYQLVNNLTTSGDCLVVGAAATANITIDLNGFTILGDGTGSGIRGDNYFEGFTIRNGTVKNFGIGLSLDGNTGLVENLQLIRNTSWGLVSVENIRVKDSIFTGNQTGLLVGQGSDLIGNLVSYNSGDGMQINGSSTVVHNTVRNNGRAGIKVACPSTLLANTATGNTGGDLVTSGPGCVNGHGIP